LKNNIFIFGLITALSFIFSFAFVSAGFSINNPKLPNMESEVVASAVNYSSVNVNNSLYWQGHTGTDGSWLTGIVSSFDNTNIAYKNNSETITGSWDFNKINITNSGTRLYNSIFNAGELYPQLNPYGNSGSQYVVLNGSLILISTISDYAGMYFGNVSNPSQAHIFYNPVDKNIYIVPNINGKTIFQDAVSGYSDVVMKNLTANNICYSNGTGCASVSANFTNVAYKNNSETITGTWSFNNAITSPNLFYLDQSTPQTVINGKPTFISGLNGNIYDSGAIATSQYPPVQSDTYVKATTTNSVPAYSPYKMTDPSQPLTGIFYPYCWISSNNNVTNQRFHIDLGSGKVITKIYYENLHYAGGTTNAGVKDFTFWGSNSASSFGDLNYSNDTGWTQLTTSQGTFDQHVSLDQADPKYITVTNNVGYRYYAFKFANTWGGTSYMGARRIELQAGTPLLSVDSINRRTYANDGKNITFDWSRIGVANFTDSNITTTGTITTGNKICNATSCFTLQELNATGAGGWVGTATSNLEMQNYTINSTWNYDANSNAYQIFGLKQNFVVNGNGNNGELYGIYQNLSPGTATGSYYNDNWYGIYSVINNGFPFTGNKATNAYFKTYYGDSAEIWINQHDGLNTYPFIIKQDDGKVFSVLPSDGSQPDLHLNSTDFDTKIQYNDGGGNTYGYFQKRTGTNYIAYLLQNSQAGYFSDGTNYAILGDTSNNAGVYTTSIISSGEIRSNTGFNLNGNSGQTWTGDPNSLTQMVFEGGIFMSYSTAFDISLIKEVTYLSTTGKLNPITFKWNEIGLKQYPNPKVWNGTIITGYNSTQVALIYPNCITTESKNLTGKFLPYQSYNRNCIDVYLKADLIKENNELKQNLTSMNSKVEKLCLAVGTGNVCK
jgi:hypothetical protein